MKMILRRYAGSSEDHINRQCFLGSESTSISQSYPIFDGAYFSLCKNSTSTIDRDEVPFHESRMFNKGHYFRYAASQRTLF